MSGRPDQGGEHAVPTTTGLHIDYVALNALRHAPAQHWQQVLALVRYEEESTATLAFTPPGIIPSPRVSCPPIGQGTALAEQWRLDGTLSSGRVGRVHYRRGDQLLFASLSVQEHEFMGGSPLAMAVGHAATATEAARNMSKTLATEATPLREATLLAYRELFQALETLGCREPLRIWHYLPQINAESAGEERYWHFNAARQEAFRRAHRSVTGNVPASSALGAGPGSAMTIFCIAAAQAPIPLENPRQCSAWAYPPQYGPRPPTFSRACLAGPNAPLLLISGTASILGHRSVHAGDVIAQTRETLRNIGALVDSANCRLAGPRHLLRSLHYKVYLRESAHQKQVEQVLREELGEHTPMLFVQADVCRRELLVEIEALGL
jgi:chorismate lyase / 3-hydroxybenzoate synthase